MGSKMTHGLLRVVVMEPTGAGNIGSIARAMANFGLCDLVLVRPRPFDMGMARDFACGGADIIDMMECVDTFDDAIAGASCVIGTTRRARGNEASLPAMEACAVIAQRLRTDKAALVFGRERSGLSKEEKRKCTFLSHIDSETGSEGSLNISHAAVIFFHGIYISSREKVGKSADIAPLSEAFDALIAGDRHYGRSDALQKIFASILMRAKPTIDEIKKLTRAFGKIAAKREG
jgi:TrmH family RNA methyltransferase